MKIIYCLNSIQQIGGIENVTINKANALTQRGIEVGIIVTDHDVSIKNNLSDKVKVYDLDINYYNDDWKSKYHILKGILIKRKRHKRVLTRILKEINPDIVISVGQSEKYFLPKIKGKWKTIREFHYCKNYRLKSAKNNFQKLLAYCINFYDFNFILKKYDRIVVLTKEDKEKNWRNNNKIICIPNPITIYPSKTSSLRNHKIVAVGRLVDQKNYISLIHAFKLVLDEMPLLVLEIWGKGILENELKNYIYQNKLEKNILLRGETLNHNEIYSESDCLVLSSKYEGWGLVLTEAMAYGLPVIAYDCPCGPKDIIIDGKNGFLIPLNNECIMADKICLLLGNEHLRKEMGKAALDRVKDFNIDKIITLWENLFNKMLY